MDICSALLVLPGMQPVLDTDAITAPGAYLPQHFVPETLESSVLTQLSGQPGVPHHVAMQYAILANNRSYATRLFHKNPYVLRKNPGLLQQLEPWVLQEIQTFQAQIPKAKRNNTYLPMLVSPEAPTERFQVVATSLNGYVPLLDQVNWAGPIILYETDEPDILARPWVPKVGLPSAASHEDCGAALAQLRLGMMASSEHPWPDWFYDGLIGCYRIRANKAPPSPMAMAARRRRAGQKAITACFQDEKRDEALATALVAPLLHNSRQHLFPRFVDLLRQGSSTQEALRFVYQIETKDFINLQR